MSSPVEGVNIISATNTAALLLQQGQNHKAKSLAQPILNQVILNQKGKFTPCYGDLLMCWFLMLDSTSSCVGVWFVCLHGVIIKLEIQN